MNESEFFALVDLKPKMGQVLRRHCLRLLTDARQLTHDQNRRGYWSIEWMGTEPEPTNFQWVWGHLGDPEVDHIIDTHDIDRECVVTVWSRHGGIHRLLSR